MRGFAIIIFGIIGPLAAAEVDLRVGYAQRSAEVDIGSGSTDWDHTNRGTAGFVTRPMPEIPWLVLGARLAYDRHTGPGSRYSGLSLQGSLGWALPLPHGLRLELAPYLSLGYGSLEIAGDRGTANAYEIGGEAVLVHTARCGAQVGLSLAGATSLCQPTVQGQDADVEQTGWIAGVFLGYRY